jgi:amino acid transporter
MLMVTSAFEQLWFSQEKTHKSSMHSVSFWTRLRWFLFGQPIASKFAYYERLPIYLGLTVFSSDALSSVAYATEEIKLTLMKAFHFSPTAYSVLGATVPISAAIVILIGIVTASYYQVIHAYPGGGGAYTVARANLGTWPGCIAGAALLIDYVLTVSVSVSAGVLAIVSMAPQLQPYIVTTEVAAVLLIMFANLRGVRESGMIFSIPTYSFILVVLFLIVVGIFRAAPPPPPEFVVAAKSNLHTLSWFIILKAFSSGCTALTGIEAISNGTQAFKEPVARNASATLVIMACLLGTMFFGTSILAAKFHIVPMTLENPNYQTVLAQIAHRLTGEGWVFYFLQVMTAGILILAANTSFADFPRLSSIIARDGFLPRVLANLGDRLVFQNGIILLALFAIILIVKFGGDTSRLIPLYAIGVFLAFTLNQFGTAVHSWKEGRKIPSMIISLIGGVATSIVTGVVLTTKFSEGAWVIPFALGAILLAFLGVKRHYDDLAQKLSITEKGPTLKKKNTVLLLVPRLHRGILEAIIYATSITKDCRALHVVLSPEAASAIKEEWKQFGADIPLVILESHYRSLIEPITEYIDQMLAEDPNRIITVIVPQAVLKHWWQNLLHNNLALRLKIELASRKNVVITNVRYFVT